MSQHQAILETLLGAAELKGNRKLADNIRASLFKHIRAREQDGYQRLARAAFVSRRVQCKAA